ncbi:MAG: HAD-IIIA family hydrolase [Bacteroidota bacterium]
MKKRPQRLKDLVSEGSWTLFLDRDGVINRRLPDDYVKHENEFEFIEGVENAIAVFSKIFHRIIVVTNQQGIGKGLMTEEMLASVHKKMLTGIEKAGGKIDKIYFCKHRKEDNHFDRKPSVGMALKAKHDFPDIHFGYSVMAGDSESDMIFGHRAGMFTALIGDDTAIARKNPKLVDFYFTSLKEMAEAF